MTLFLFLVTFADLLGVPDGGPDHNSRDSFVGVGRGFDILISAPKMKKKVFPDSAYFCHTLMAPLRNFYKAFLLKTKKAPSPGVSVQLPASCCFEKSRK